MKDGERNLLLIHDLIREKSEALDRAHDTLESKAGVLMGFLAALIAATVAIFLQGTFNIGTHFYLVAGVVLFFLSVLLIGTSLWSRPFENAPKVSSLYSEGSLKMSHIDFVNQNISDMAEAFKKNCAIQESKAHLYNWAVGVLILGLFIMLLGLFSPPSCHADRENRAGRFHRCLPGTNRGIGF